MKSINLLSIIQAYRALNNNLFQKLMRSYGIDVIKGIRNYELDGIELLLNELLKFENYISVIDGFYIGFSIPQIGKEFDLLRFSRNNIINIEIKSESTIEKIQKQQIRNYYYLSFLNKETNIYTYVSNENKLYKLTISPISKLTQEVNISELFNQLKSQNAVTYDNLETVFNPADYLVSPFNSTDKFINGNYFLTVQQENIYNDIQRFLLDPNTNFTAITGNAGTGKTLLTYHIAKECMLNGLKVLILHCAQLNKGHDMLINNWGWSINMSKYAPDFKDYDVIIIDEAQRMYPIQFDKFVNCIKSLQKKCIFSYDAKQYLRENERTYNIKDRIESELLCKPYKLTDKIRTNKEIALFIKKLFNEKNIPSESKHPNINFSYCKDYESAKALLDMMYRKGWKVPNYTPGTRTTFQYENYTSKDSDCAHSIIGQEFMNVVIVLDESFNYNSNGELIANNKYYSQKQMLYQIITRAVKKLHVIIINNEVMLNRCIQILS